MRTVSLFVGLAAVWLLLSGHYEPLLLAFGAVSCVFVSFLARRFDGAGERAPLSLTWRLPVYWLWLAVEIVKANVDVARRVVDPRLPIDPHLVEVKASQRSELARLVFANSITLTPGTVSVDLGKDRVLVHALTREGAEALLAGKMDAKVTALEGSS